MSQSTAQALASEYPNASLSMDASPAAPQGTKPPDPRQDDSLHPEKQRPTPSCVDSVDAGGLTPAAGLQPIVPTSTSATALTGLKLVADDQKPSLHCFSTALASSSNPPLHCQPPQYLYSSRVTQTLDPDLEQAFVSAANALLSAANLSTASMNSPTGGGGEVSSSVSEEDPPGGACGVGESDLLVLLASLQSLFNSADPQAEQERHVEQQPRQADGIVGAAIGDQYRRYHAEYQRNSVTNAGCDYASAAQIRVQCRCHELPRMILHAFCNHTHSWGGAHHALTKSNT